MKRLFVLILLLTLAVTIVFPAPTARAEDVTYLEIDRDGVYLYDNTFDAPPLFVIPRTYYVKILRTDLRDNYMLVEYNGVKGVIKSTDVSGKTVTNVENPYYTGTNVSAYAETYLYERPAISSRTNLAAYGLTLLYLGKTKGEQYNYGTDTWFAVCYTNRVYFIHSAMTANLNLLEAAFSPVHPNSVKEASATAVESEAEEKEKAQEDGFDLVRLLLILGMLVPIVIVLFLLFRPSGRRERVKHKDERVRYDRERRYPRDRYYRDEEDYDDD